LIALKATIRLRILVFSLILLSGLIGIASIVLVLASGPNFPNYLIYNLTSPVNGTVLTTFDFNITMHIIENISTGALDVGFNTTGYCNYSIKIHNTSAGVTHVANFSFNTTVGHLTNISYASSIGSSGQPNRTFWNASAINYTIMQDSVNNTWHRMNFTCDINNTAQWNDTSDEYFFKIDTIPPGLANITNSTMRNTTTYSYLELIFNVSDNNTAICGVEIHQDNTSGVGTITNYTATIYQPTWEHTNCSVPINSI